MCSDLSFLLKMCFSKQGREREFLPLPAFWNNGIIYSTGDWYALGGEDRLDEFKYIGGMTRWMTGFMIRLDFAAMG